MLKKCSQCGSIKRRSDFYPKMTSADGLYRKCKSCKKQEFKEYYRKRKAKANEQSHSKVKICIMCKEIFVNGNWYPAGHGTSLSMPAQDRLIPSHCESCKAYCDDVSQKRKDKTDEKAK